MISPSELTRLGMPETSLKVTHPLTGVEGYRVGMETFHHLHCINLLRRVTYKDYYEPLGGEFAHRPEALQAHTGQFALLTAPQYLISSFHLYIADWLGRSLPGGAPTEYAM